MMDFARRLAPVRDSESTRAVAVLPSRAASAQVVHDAQRPQELPPDAGVLPRMPEEASSRRGVAGFAAAADTSAAEAAHAGSAQSGPRLADLSFAATPAPKGGFAAAEPARVPGSPTGTGFHATEPRSPDVSWQGAAVVRPERPSRSPAVAARLAVAPAEADPVAALDAQADRRNGTAPPAPVTLQQPMSQAALASRAGTDPTPRPVVRVTIDRIEVRAPAGRPAPAPAPRTRAVTPSVSLSDYLRRGGGVRGGRP